MSCTMIRLATARIVQYPTDSDLVLVNNKIGISPKLVFKKTKVAIRWPRGETMSDLINIKEKEVFSQNPL